MAHKGVQFRPSGGQSPRQQAAEKPAPIPAPALPATTPGEVERVLTTDMAGGYKPQLPIYNFRDEYFNPFDFYYDLEAMLRHDSVKEPLANVKSPISQMQVSVEGSSTRVVKFLIAEWEKFKEQWLPKVQDTGYAYGWMGAQFVYSVEGGLLVQDQFKDFAPRDTQPLIRKNDVVGIQVRNIRSETNQNNQFPGSAKGFPAKGFWYAHRPRYGQHYGQSQVEGAWKPWRRLTGRDGVEEVIDLETYRSGTGTVVVGAPLEDTKATNQPVGPTRQSALQRALELAENLKAGGGVAIPTTCYENGQPKWSVNFEQPQSNLSNLLEAVDFLYKSISKAIGWYPELSEAAETGSGFSGRMIPLQAFLMSQQVTAQDLFQAWFQQVGKPLIWWNFGQHAWVRCKVVSLLKSYRQASMPPQPPPPPMGAGAGAGPMPAAPMESAAEAPPPMPDANGRVPYKGPRGGSGWKDASGHVHYGQFSSEPSEVFYLATQAVDRGLGGDDAAIALRKLARTLPDLEPEELDALRTAIVGQHAEPEEPEADEPVTVERPTAEEYRAIAREAVEDGLATFATRMPQPVAQQPTINIAPPAVHLAAPVIPDIILPPIPEIRFPEQPAPVVNITISKADLEAILHPPVVEHEACPADEAQPVTSKIEYDEQGRPCKVIKSDGTCKVFVYNAAGQVVQIVESMVEPGECGLFDGEDGR